MRKICSICEIEKPIEEFHLRKDTDDGHYGSCKECRKSYNRERYERKRTGILEQKKEYWQENKEKISGRRKQPKRAEQRKEYGRKYREKNPLHNYQSKARNKLNREVRKGNIVSPKTLQCLHCGKSACDYHHHKGYEPEHWLNVIPLCRSCHVNCHPGRKIPTVPEDPSWGRKLLKLSEKQIAALQKGQRMSKERIKRKN